MLALAGCSEPTRPPLSAYDSALSDLFDAPREDLPVADRAPEEPDGAPQDTDRTAPDAFPVAPEASPDASDGSPPSPDGASLDAPADAPGAVDADGAVTDSTTMDSAERDSAAPDAPVTEGSTMDLLVGEAPLLADAPLRDRGVRDTPSADTAPEDVGPSRGAPTVTILEPAAGATLSGAFTLRYTFTAPDGEDLLSVLVDGVEVASSDVFVTTLSLDTSRQAPGPHRLEVAITDRRGGRGAATVDVVYAPLPFRLLSVTPERDRYAPGETVVAVVTWDRPVPVFTADFSALDAAFDAARVAYTDEGDGRYTVRYPLSTTGTRADGRYHFSLTARDRATPPREVTARIPLTVSRLGPMPFTLGAGSFVESAWTPLPSGPPRPELTAVTGSATVSASAPARLTVAWTARPGVPVRSVQVRAVGAYGHWTVPVTDPAATRLDLTVGLLDTLDPPLPEGLQRLAFRVVDTTYTSSPERTQDVRVEALGRGGGTATIRGQVRFDKLLVTLPRPLCGAAAAPTTVTTNLTAEAFVRVLRARDGLELVRGALDPTGRYSLTLPVSTDEAFVEVWAIERLGTTEALTVRDFAGLNYHHASRRFTPTRGTGTLNVTIPVALAEPFNILATLSRAWAFTEDVVGMPLGNLEVAWQPGRNSPECRTAACYKHTGRLGAPTIGLRGIAAVNDDGWDDPVLRHEFGHFVMDELSVSNSPGGPHGPGRFSDPRLSWSEGFATFWGGYSVATVGGGSAGGDDCYVDTIGSGSFSFLVDAETGVQLNTSTPQDSTSQVSEAVASGVLWRLREPPERAMTGVDLPALLWTIFTYLPDPARTYDGGSSGVDLVDFLDGWLCAAPCREAELRAQAVGRFLFHHLPPRDRDRCPAPYAEPADPAMATRCADVGALVLTPTGLSRYLVSDGTITATTLRRAVGELPLGLTLPGSFALLRPKHPLALLRPFAGGPTRAVVLNHDERSASLVSLLREAERELDLDDDPTTTRPMGATPAGMSRFELPALPRSLAVTPEGRFALVALDNDEAVALNLDRRETCTPFGVRPPGVTGAVSPEDVAVSNDGARAWVALSARAGNALAVVDMACVAQQCIPPNTPCSPVTGFIALPAGGAGGSSPGGLHLSSDGRFLAVANRGGDVVEVVDTATSLPATRVRLGCDPIVAAGTLPQVTLWNRGNTHVVIGHGGIPTGSMLPSGSGTLRRFSTADGNSGRDLGIHGQVLTMAYSRDQTWLYVGDRRGGLTAVPLSVFSGLSGRCPALGSRTPCPPNVTLTAPVRALALLP